MDSISLEDSVVAMSIDRGDHSYSKKADDAAAVIQIRKEFPETWLWWNELEYVLILIYVIKKKINF